MARILRPNWRRTLPNWVDVAIGSWGWIDARLRPNRERRDHGLSRDFARRIRRLPARAHRDGRRRAQADIKGSVRGRGWGLATGRGFSGKIKPVGRLRHDLPDLFVDTGK